MGQRTHNQARAGYVWHVDRYIPREVLYRIECGEEAMDRQRLVPPLDQPPLKTLELFDTRHLHDQKPSPEQLYLDATG